MDYPSLIIPVTKVDTVLDAKPSREEFWSEDDKAIHDMCTYSFIFKLYACSKLSQMTPNASRVFRLVSRSLRRTTRKKSCWDWEK